MRWMWITCAALAVGLSLPGSPEAKDEARAPTPGDIAQWVCSGNEKALARAAHAATSLDAGQMLELFAEIRSQTRVYSLLEKKRIKNLKWEQTRLEVAVQYLVTITGLNFYVTPKVKEEKLDDIQINMHVDNVSLAHLLNLITDPFELAWGIRGKVVTIATSEEMPRLDFSSDEEVAKRAVGLALRKKIDATTVNLSVDEQKLGDVVKILQIQTGFNIVVDPRIAARFNSAVASKIELRSVALSTVLNMVVAEGGQNGDIWTTHGNVIFITNKEFLPEGEKKK